MSPATVERGQPPAVGQLTKLYWSAHVEDLKQEFFSTKAMGPATVDEWLKGLSGRGAEWRNDASRWEKWATINDGLRQMRTLLYPGYHPPAISSHDTATSMAEIASNAGLIPGISTTNIKSPAAAFSVASSQRNDSTPDPFRRSSSGTVSYFSGRHERTKEEVAELKAVRKAEIERRAFALDPPLPAHVLAHIPSFQAALQIITPMDDQGWEMLKPRLLAQRVDAEQREKESVARVKQELDEKRSLNANAKEARDARDAEDSDWDETQAPVRARIAGYADEIIRDGWEDGEKIGRDNCAKFAVEALTYIRKRFYAEVAKDAAAARAAGKLPTSDPPQGPFTQKLTLENMKWIFDVKVKPLTERYRKEIFMCNGCDVTVRSYGFEGVIQHYAAKHTTALSIGNVVVHWRAEWPEHPPFTSEPKSAKNFYQPQPAPSGYSMQQQGASQPPYQPAPGGPAPGYGPSSWGEPIPPGSHAPYPTATGGYVPPPGYGASPYPPTDSFHSYPPAQAQQPSYNGPPQPASGGSYSYSYGAYQSNGQVGYHPTQSSSFSAQYPTQLEDMAHMARDLWNSTANMKDTLSIVRVQVVVYHLAKRFHAKFHVPLPLSTFIDGLSNHKEMRPVRNVNGLVCRVCHQGVGGYVASDEERKSWSLPQLTAHFQTKHVEPFVQTGQYGQLPEWTVDMVLLPDPAAVTNLRAAISMDGHKYHLVNEAVPHLLQAPSIPVGATDGAPVWQNQGSNYQGFQDVPADKSAPYYGQIQLNGPIQDGSKGQYSGAVGAAAPHPNEPPFPYSQAEQLAVSTNPIPPAGAYAPPEPVPAVHSVALSRSDESGNKSSQGHRQRFKKHKKKGNRDSMDEEARKRTEEEEKMAEEEAEREADVIRAMWAADRAVAASKSGAPEGQQVEKQGKTNKPSKSKPHSKPNTPKPNQRFQSRPPRNSPRRDEGESPLCAQDLQADPIAPQSDVAYRAHQLSNVSYVEDNREQPPRQAWQRSPNPYDRYGPPPSNVGRPRSRSPTHQIHGRPLPAGQYHQRTSSRRQQVDEPVYQSRPPVPVDDVRYGREPPRDDFVTRGYGAPAPAPELIEYEIIEYRNPDGTIYVEERPLRRIPNSEAERYYREAPPPVSAPYDRGEPLPHPPSSYRRDQPPPLPPAAEPYQPPYERTYSRAPQTQPPPPPQAGADVYDPRYPFNAPPRRAEPPPRARPEPAYYEEEEYDPRYPNGPSHVPVAPPRPNYR